MPAPDRAHNPERKTSVGEKWVFLYSTANRVDVADCAQNVGWTLDDVPLRRYGSALDVASPGTHEAPLNLVVVRIVGARRGACFTASCMARCRIQYFLTFAGPPPHVWAISLSESPPPKSTDRRSPLDKQSTPGREGMWALWHTTIAFHGRSVQDGQRWQRVLNAVGQNSRAENDYWPP